MEKDLPQNINNPYTILVADDDNIYREAVSTYARHLGYVVVEATSGHEAYEILKNTSIDGVITDLRMKNGTGIELLRKIRNTHGSLPKIPKIIVNTGLLNGGEKYLKSLGAQGIFLKPIDLPTLFNHLVQLIAQAG